jgi:hypothetical protein
MEELKNKSAEVFKVVGNWSTQSVALKEKFAQLTDADLKLEVGKEEDMLTRVCARLHKNRDEVVNIIKKGQSVKV